jgi:hypothetical protein
MPMHLNAVAIGDNLMGVSLEPFLPFMVAADASIN